MSHPGFFHWWKAHHGAPESSAHACGGFARERWAQWEPWREASSESGQTFGVRRPLRFLAYKLELDESQVATLAKILSDLKTERAQAEVDARRTTSAFADAVSGASFDSKQAESGARLRTESADKVAQAVAVALGKIHALLRPEQREKLAYLIRTGVVTL